MEKFDPNLWWLAILGFFAGMVTVTLIGRWLRFIQGLRGEPRPIADGVARTQFRVLGIPLLALVHPIPWLVFGALPAAIYYFIWARASTKASWFFAGLGVAVLLWLLGTAALVLKVRRRRELGQSEVGKAAELPPNKSLGRTRGR